MGKTPTRARVSPRSSTKATTVTNDVEVEEEYKAFPLRIPRRLHAALRHYAVGQGKSLNKVIEHALKAWWDALPEKAAYEKLVRREQESTGKGTGE